MFNEKIEEVPAVELVDKDFDNVRQDYIDTKRDRFTTFLAELCEKYPDKKAVYTSREGAEKIRQLIASCESELKAAYAESLIGAITTEELKVYETKIPLKMEDILLF